MQGRACEGRGLSACRPRFLHRGDGSNGTGGRRRGWKSMRQALCTVQRCDPRGATWGTTGVPPPASGPRRQSSRPVLPLEPAPALGAALLTCEARVDLVVAGPEPQNSAVRAAHPVHGGGGHLLEVASAVSAAEEEADVAPDGLEDFLGLGYGGEERPFTGAPAVTSAQGLRTPAQPMRGLGLPVLLSTFQGSLYS